MFCAPIFNLRFLGLICPCLEKEEDRAARLSLNQLNHLGKHVDWHTRSKIETGKGFVRKMFGRQHTDKTPPIPARLVLKDSKRDNINNGDFFPQLQLEPLMKEESNENPGFLERQTSNYTLDIPLHHICNVESIEPTMIVIITKDVHSTDEDSETKEAARISWLSSDDRDKVCLDLKGKKISNKSELFRIALSFFLSFPQGRVTNKNCMMTIYYDSFG